MQALSLDSLMMGYKVMAMRKFATSIKDSIYSDFKSFNRALSKRFTDLTIIQNEIRSKRNLIRFKGLDDPEKIKGISKFTKVFLDEITEYNIDDLKQVRKRLRGLKNQQIIACWNPISKNHWINKKWEQTYVWKDMPTEIEGHPQSKLSDTAFVKKNKEGNAILIKTTYLDNYWVVGHESGGGFRDVHTIADFEFDKENDENNYNIYALGEYGEPTEGLIFQRHKNWFVYSELPDYDFYETYGLDFGGGGVDDKRKCYPEIYKFDEPDGTSTTVLVRLMINKSSMSCYVKLLLYKAYISPTDLSDVCQEKTITTDEKGYKKKKNILADNARADKIKDLLNDGINVIGAKTKEGASSKVVTGIDITKKYKIYFHEDDIPCHVDAANYKWETNKDGELTGNPVKKFENVWDAVRYGLVNFDLYSW
jgi:PBSX family phage terminase large subunit